MRETITRAGEMHKVNLVEFNNVLDLANYVKNGKHNSKRMSEVSPKWAGGTFDDFLVKSRKGDESYARKAEKYVEEFANLAVQDYGVDYEYNTTFGVLDYQAAMAGDPMCMYGPAWVETDKSPVNIYIDTWTSASVSTTAMENRGIAVLALAMSLSMFRPVTTHFVTGLQHSPTRTNAICTIPVPTAPMDLSMASWMIADPIVFRWGMLSAIWEIAKSDAFCGIPRLSDVKFQELHMGDWLAKREGVHDTVFLRLMMDNGQWGDYKYCLAWVKRQLARFVPEAAKV